MRTKVDDPLAISIHLGSRNSDLVAASIAKRAIPALSVGLTEMDGRCTQKTVAKGN